ncbi:MAG: hypothetical protein EZS28_033109 [Streblomastix strix]|uniref:Uncharacterized protein n=1 Tax=Streblomastix strix TaxID=222440 RepID=A0A5J4UMB5_9EUKA|nr:MAG: hypothetical protein EZS28_033109 [Streblomastix strix]
MNSSYGSDGMNTEKYHKVKIMNKKQTERPIRSNAFMDEQKISEDSYLVQMNPEHCSCKTPLQVVFFELDNAKYCIRGDIYDEKKILRLAIERQGISMIALAPKNYMIETNYNGNSKIKLKGFNQKSNKITKAQIIDCINQGKITKCVNLRLGQKNHQMSQLSIEKNGITGIHDKMIVLSNQSCCPYIFGLSSKDYSFQDN